VGHLVKNERSFYDVDMPRVTPEYTAARRQHILDAAQACFLRDGFHQTSMQDVQREAGLSAGAIYLYFKSKNELILGIATRILDALATLLPSEPVPEAEMPDLAHLVRRVLTEAERLHQERQVFSLAIQIWAEATRDPVMLASLQVSIAGLKLRVRDVLARCQAQGLIPVNADAAQLTMPLIGLAQGYIVQRVLLEETRLDDYLAGVEALLAGSGPIPASAGKVDAD